MDGPLRPSLQLSVTPVVFLLSQKLCLMMVRCKTVALLFIRIVEDTDKYKGKRSDLWPHHQEVNFHTVNSLNTELYLNLL